MIVKNFSKMQFGLIGNAVKCKKESKEAHSICQCRKVDSKISNMLIKPPLEVSQILFYVNVNQSHVHIDGIIIV